MSTDLVVAITLGQRDLQILAIDGQGLCRVSPNRNEVGVLHRALLDGSLPSRLWLPPNPVREQERGEANWNRNTIAFTVSGTRLAHSTDLNIATEHQGIWLIPGLLREAFLTLRTDVENGLIRLRRVLVFHTDRGPDDPRSRREPVAAGPLIANWLQENVAGLTPEEVRIVPVLQAGEELLIQDALGNSVLAPAVAGHIDLALFEARQVFPRAAARLHIAGGIPQVSTVVDVAARLHFRTVDDRTSPEFQPTQAMAGRQRTALEMFDARRRARDLVCRGQLEAAAVLVEDFREATWACCVTAAAYYFQGYMTRSREHAENLPVQCATRGELLSLDLCLEKKPRCFHVALRAEAAARANDQLSLAAQTMTFQDVALFDAVDYCLRRDSSLSCIDWNRREIIKEAFAPGLTQVQHAAANLVRKQITWVRNKEIKGDAWFDGERLRAYHLWEVLLLVELIAMQPGQQSLATALDELSRALREPSNQGNVPANFRNMIIHSLPEEDDIRVMVQLFESQSRLLWHKPKGGSRTFLAENSRASQVLTALGVSSARQRYDSLIDALVLDIESGR